MEYFGVEVRGDRLQKALKTDQDGTHYTNMIAYARKKGFDVFASEGVTLEKVKGFIDEGYPLSLFLSKRAYSVHCFAGESLRAYQFAGPSHHLRIGYS